MKFAYFSVSSKNNRVMVSMPSNEELEKLLDGLEKKFGVKIEVEVKGLCG